MSYNMAMKMTKNLLNHMAYRIVKGLVAQGLITAEDRNRLVESVSTLLEEEIQKEEQLEEEVRNILLQHSDKIRVENVDYQEMFRMIKQKIAKERGIVL
ncbi:MAG TPA: DUF507 family protein [Candidatus Aminicenantes bacterium]|nr:DUF507 family protein [Candidatus Aminicenantes bacterium]HPB54609.1 DUF507 family protein [Candidatus Aminicenantes bacterium]HPT00836.1 DUF507 family protein [Candidatus Aminicenantes bacterium]